MDKLIKYKKRASNWAISALCLFVAFWVILIIIQSSDILAISVLLTAIGIIISVAFSLLYTIRYSVSFAQHKRSPKNEIQQTDDTLIGYLKASTTHTPIEPALSTRPAHAPIVSVPQDVHSSNSFSSYMQYGGVDAELLNIDLMEGHDFEHWCASLLRKIGFTNVEVTRGSGDQGVDVFAVKDGIRYAVQCKCYSSDLGNKPVQEVNAGKTMPQYRCQIGVVMTNRYFTQGAKELADATGTLLWDRDWIRYQLNRLKMNSSYPSPSPISGFSGSFLDTAGESPYQHDPMLIDAVNVVLATGQASVSMLQRQLKLGYARAARIIDEMEVLGIVGPFQGAQPRKILITQRQWQSMKINIRN